MVRGVDVDPARYLLAELGPVPERLSGRRVWRRAARRIAMYREDFAITDPDRALGPQPRELRQRDAWQIARRDVDEARAELLRTQGLERSRQRDTGRDLASG